MELRLLTIFSLANCFTLAFYIPVFLFFFFFFLSDLSLPPADPYGARRRSRNVNNP